MEAVAGHPILVAHQGPVVPNNWWFLQCLWQSERFEERLTITPLPQRGIPMKDGAMSPGVDFGKCIEFHGHTCPGLAIGFQAARILMERLGATKAPDEELIAIVETDACGADAIQVMTGCTFGKGNFLFKNYVEIVESFVERFECLILK